MLSDLVVDWLNNHVADLDDPERYLQSVERWSDFWAIEQKAGRVPSPVRVRDITPALVKRFIRWRQDAGVGGHAISRDLAALRGPLRYAWKNHKLVNVPFIPDVPEAQKAPPRDRVLSFPEIARLMEKCLQPDREHGLRFMVLELGTAGRPEAVLELHDHNVDLENNLIDPNQPGRRHLRKRRTIVPIAKHVRPWVEGVKGKLIVYRAPITNPKTLAKLAPDAPRYLERPVKSIRTLWDAICAECDITGATPKTLRHTMLTWLARRGIPKEQRQQLAGHVPQDTTSKNYEHLTPDYLAEAIEGIDAFFDELSKHTKAHLRYTYDTQRPALKLVA